MNSRPIGPKITISSHKFVIVLKPNIFSASGIPPINTVLGTLLKISKRINPKVKFLFDFTTNDVFKIISIFFTNAFRFCCKCFEEIGLVDIDIDLCVASDMLSKSIALFKRNVDQLILLRNHVSGLFRIKKHVFKDEQTVFLPFFIF